MSTRKPKTFKIHPSKALLQERVNTLNEAILALHYCYAPIRQKLREIRDDYAGMLRALEAINKAKAEAKKAAKNG